MVNLNENSESNSSPKLQTLSRTYSHHSCNGQTKVDGHDFFALTDPFAYVSRIVCPQCNKETGLDEFLWVDTGETIADYRLRVRKSLSPLFVLAGWTVAPAIGGLIGFALGWIFPPRNFVNAISYLLVGGIIALAAFPVYFRKWLGMDFRNVK